MKKLIILLAIVALGFGATGATCLQNVQEVVCNPPADVIAVVNAAAPLVAVAINAFIKQQKQDSEEYVNAVMVQGAITAIQGGACVSLTQLNAVIAWLQSDEAQGLQAKAMVKAGPARAVSVSAQPLIDWRDAQAK